MSTPTTTVNDSHSNTLKEEVIAAAAEIQVFDASGNKLKFGSLFELQRTVVIFIRHFFCGRCQAYVAEISKTPHEALDKVNVNIVIIGCGDWSLIKNYREITLEKPNDRISIYAEPTRTLYRAMGMTIETWAGTPSDQPKKSYATESVLRTSLMSIKRAFRHPFHIGKQGNLGQLGGEFVLGPKYACSFSHCMQHTEDHAEIADLLHNAGVLVN